MKQDSIYNKAIKNPELVQYPDLNSNFGISTMAYAFTNETLDCIIKNVEHKGKDIFGILAGSGDHMITSIMKGCNDYTGLDISVFSCFFSELKLAGLKNLSFSPFKDFFGYQINPNSSDKKPVKKNKHFFSKKTYCEIRGDISKNAQSFFDKRICPSSSDRRLPQVSDYLRDSINSSAMSYIPYLRSEEAYEKTKESLLSKENHLLYLGNLNDFFHNKKSFDIIYLSNVLAHCFNQDKKWDSEFALSLISKTSESLNEDGVIIIYNMLITKEFLEKEGYEVCQVSAPINTDSPDMGILRDALLISKYRQGS